MSEGLWVVALVASPFLIYYVARLISAAWFSSKRDYERKRNQHE